MIAIRSRESFSVDIARTVAGTALTKKDRRKQDETQ